jgi:hypothetical protein
MQVAQYQKDQILKLKAAIGAFIKKRINVFGSLVSVIDIVEIVVSCHNKFVV